MWSMYSKIRKFHCEKVAFLGTYLFRHAAPLGNGLWSFGGHRHSWLLET